MLNHLKNYKTFVIANDAGGAQNLYRITKKIRNPYIYYLSGPAKKLFSAVKNTRVKKLETNIINSELLLCTTSFDDHTYSHAIQIAKKNNIYTVVLLDHWVYFRQRLKRFTGALLPDEIIVTDRMAYKIAKKSFPYIKVNLIKDMYLDEQLRKISYFKKNLNIDMNMVLYCTNKIQSPKKKIKHHYDEYDALIFFLQNIRKLNCNINKVILRIHPSEKLSKYDHIIKKNKNKIKIIKDNNSDLSKQIALSNFIVGCETYPLVIALKAQKKVFYSIPPNGMASLLPFSQIKYIRDM